MTLRQTFASQPRDARDTLFLLFVIVWVIAPQVGNLPGWATLMASGLILWRGWLAWKGLPLPSRWTLLVFVAAAVAGTLFTHRTILGRDAGVTLIVMLLALKMLELRARRDAMVVFFLGFFTMLSNFFYSQSLVTAAAMLVAAGRWEQALDTCLAHEVQLGEVRGCKAGEGMPACMLAAAAGSGIARQVMRALPDALRPQPALP